MAGCDCAFAQTRVDSQGLIHKGFGRGFWVRVVDA